MNCTYGGLHFYNNAKDACDYLRNCSYEYDYFNLLTFNYCLAGNRQYITWPLIIVVLLLCFYFLSTSVDEYVSGIVGRISVKLNMSQNLAGLTLLAFGNQVADITVAIVSGGEEEGGIEASLSTILGADSLVIGFVMPTVIFLGNGVIVKGQNFTRDLLTYLIALILIFSLGIFLRKLNLLYGFIIFGLYIVYVALCIVMENIENNKKNKYLKKERNENESVEQDDHNSFKVKLFADDEEKYAEDNIKKNDNDSIEEVENDDEEEDEDKDKENGEEKKEEKKEEEKKDEEKKEEEKKEEEKKEEEKKEEDKKDEEKEEKEEKKEDEKVKENRDDINNEDDKNEKGNESGENKNEDSKDVTMKLEKEIEKREKKKKKKVKKEKKKKEDKKNKDKDKDENVSDDIDILSDKMSLIEDMVSLGGNDLFNINDFINDKYYLKKSGEALQRQTSILIKEKHLVYNRLHYIIKKYYLNNKKEKWSELSIFKKIIRIFVEFPLNLVRDLTTPPFEKEKWKKEFFALMPLSISLCLSLFFGLFKYYIKFPHFIFISLYYTISVFICYKLYKKSYRGSLPKCEWVLLISALIMSMIWIYTITKILVQMIIDSQYLLPFEVSRSFLIMTVLAVGNALPDFLIDCTLSRSGYAEMALSGTIGSPVFSLLFGFGLSLIKTFAFSEKREQIFDLLTFTPSTKVILCAIAGIFINLVQYMLFFSLVNYRVKRYVSYSGFCVFFGYLASLCLVSFVFV